MDDFDYSFYFFSSLKTRNSQEIASSYVFPGKPLIPPFRKKPRFPWNRSSPFLAEFPRRRRLQNTVHKRVQRRKKRIKKRIHRRRRRRRRRRKRSSLLFPGKLSFSPERNKFPVNLPATRRGRLCIILPRKIRNA